MGSPTRNHGRGATVSGRPSNADGNQKLALGQAKLCPGSERLFPGPFGRVCEIWAYRDNFCASPLQVLAALAVWESALAGASILHVSPHPEQHTKPKGLTVPTHSITAQAANHWLLHVFNLRCPVTPFTCRVGIQGNPLTKGQKEPCRKILKWLAWDPIYVVFGVSSTRRKEGMIPRGPSSTVSFIRESPKWFIPKTRKVIVSRTSQVQGDHLYGPRRTWGEVRDPSHGLLFYLLLFIN